MLVDDHALFREGLGNMLRPHGLQIVGTAANGREAETQVASLQPDLILMDIHMPEQDGLETTRRLKQQFPRIKIVMLTMAEDEALLLQALKYGASGYLLKNLPTPQFLSLLNEVMAGKIIIAPTLATKALTALAQQDDTTPTIEETEVAPLTDRQQEVLACLAQGMSNKQIGEQLHISENTVKYHVRQMMERLQLETRHELIRYHLDS
jgi:two-component system NarL family response regulator